MSQLDLTNFILKSLYGNNIAIYDDAEFPSVMVFIPKFTLGDVIDGAGDTVHPAFVVNGVEVEGIYISKYLNTVIDGKAYSLPGEDPANNITLETATQFCAAKGHGWHLMNAWEWAAIALWCKKNGFFPKGNNSAGKDHSEAEMVATFSDADNGPGYEGRTLTGTGPVSWSHNGKLDGIYDLNGNVREWCEGLRLFKGELQIQENGSDEWKAIDGDTGAFITPDGNGTTANSIKLDMYDEETAQWRTENTMRTSVKRYSQISKVISAVPENANVVLRALALLPDDASFDYEGETLSYVNDEATTVYATKGGDYDNRPSSAAAGVFCTELANADSERAISIGFRCAYYKF